MIARFVLALSLTVVASVPQLALAQAPIAPCELLTGSVADVKPHRAEHRVGKAVMSRLDGASLFVRAQPGLTAEWLQRSLATHVAKMKNASMPDCPLEAKDLRVIVHSAGAGFWVKVTTPHHDQPSSCSSGQTLSCIAPDHL